MFDTLLAIVGSAAFVGALGWAIQVSNRLSVVETERDGLKELIEEKFEGVYRRLDSIEDKM